MAEPPKVLDKAVGLLSLERLADAPFVLRLTNLALFADVVLGRVYGKGLPSVTYAWSVQLPPGVLAAAAVAYGILIAFAAPILRFAFQRLVTPFLPLRIWDAVNGSWASGDASHDRDLDRVLSDLLVFGTLLLTEQLLVPTSLVATLLRSVDSGTHASFAWASALLGGLAVLCSLVAAR